MTVLNINVKAIDDYEGSKVLDGNTYLIRITWTPQTQKWYMNIKGISNSVEIDNIALLPGVDLFAKSGYSELGELWMVDQSGANENPNFNDMGGRFRLEYTTIGD